VDEDARLLPSPDPKAFGRFYARHLDVVTACVARRVRRPDLTFDLVAETFARALQHRSRYGPRRGPARAGAVGWCTVTRFTAGGLRAGQPLRSDPSGLRDLRDAEDPAARAAVLLRTPGLSGRRLGPGWLVAAGGTAFERRRLLAALDPRP